MELKAEGSLFLDGPPSFSQPKRQEEPGVPDLERELGKMGDRAAWLSASHERGKRRETKGGGSS